MKPKILILSIEEYRHEGMRNRELKALSEKYDVLLSHSITDALDQIARAKLLKKSPIRGLVFQRNTLVANRGKCRVVREFAEAYSDKRVTAINMIHNDQDSEACDYAVSATFCKVEDWEYVQVIFEHDFR